MTELEDQATILEKTKQVHGNEIKTLKEKYNAERKDLTE